MIGHLRKRLLWQAQQQGLTSLLPYVKRHLVQAASFFLAYSVPSTMCLGWRHPDSLAVARPRCEVACVVCACKDWLENRFPVHLWKEATDAKPVGEIIHGPGSTQLLVHEGSLCFGNRHIINKYLATSLYAALMPRIPQQELYASSVVHPADPAMQWLLHTRRVPLQREDSAAQSVFPQAASVAQPALPHPCAGVGNPDETAWICLECARCLCVDDKLIEMPKLALANLMWLGREPRLLQTASLGLRMLLGGGRACFRKLLLGRGPKEELQSGLAGNHVLVSQAKPTKTPTLPPTAEELSENFVAVFCKSIDEVEKSQFLKVARGDYKILARERCAVNAAFAAKSMNWNAVDGWPEIGVPEELRRCAMQMPEAEQMQFASSGPGTIRQPIDAAKGAEDSDASDELAEELDEPSGCASSAAQPAPQDGSYDEETVLGIDQTAGPNVVQSLATFKLQTELLREHVQNSVAQPGASSDMSAMTAQAARQADCTRIVYDLQAAGKKLLKYDFQEEVASLDKQEKGLLVPTGFALSTFDAATWTECFTEFWFGDTLPNQRHRPRRITFEEIFSALPDREELEYTLSSDERPYAARAKSRFDTPEIIIVFGDTLRRLELFQSARAVMKRHGFQANVKLVCNATSEDCMKEIEARVGQPGVCQNAGAEQLQFHVPRPLQVALSQMLITTKNVPLTDGYRRNLRHEGHNLNVMFGALIVFATYNFADNYAPLMFQLVRHNGSAEQPGDGEVVGTINVGAEQLGDAPRMPTLKEMHKLVGQSPRAQAKFFLLMDDLADRFFMGIDGSFIGRHRVHSTVPQNLCEDSYASTCEPSLGGFGIAELEPFESQTRGFSHGHRKKYSIPTIRHQDIIDMFTHQSGLQVQEFLQASKAALLACASSLQYEDSTLPAHQMGQTVLPEKFTAKQQQQSRLDGGVEEDSVTERPLLETTADERQGHEVLEHRRAAAERRPPSNCYSQVDLTGCHQSLMPTYRLPQRIGSILPLDELGMASSPSTTSAERPVVIWTEDEETNHVSNVCLVTDGATAEMSVEELADDARS
jgi:hypothetical protein